MVKKNTAVHQHRILSGLLFWIFSVCIFYHSDIRAQDSLKISPPKEDTIQTLIRFIQKGQNDSVRISANTIFRNYFEKRLFESGSFDVDFSELKNISIISSPDKVFRIYSWLLPSYDGNNFDYFGYVQVHDKKKNQYSLFTLLDSTTTIQKPESEKLSPGRWLGAIYYGLAVVKKSGTNYYTLIGWKGKNQSTTQKIIEVMYFDKGVPRFGYPLFKTDKVYRNRVLFSYTSQVSMSLRYEEQKNMIVFDHLSEKKGFGDAADALNSGPDGSYDAFKFKGGRWILYHDVDIRTDWKPKKELPHSPSEKK